MPQTHPNGIVTAVGSDPYDYVRDAARTADSTNVPVICVNEAEMLALTPYEGMMAVRLDLSGRIKTYLNAKWGPPEQANITTLGTGWVSTQTPFVRPDSMGATASIFGRVQFGSGASGSNMLTIPTEFRPKATGLTFIGAALTSNGSSNPIGGQTVELAIDNGAAADGVLKILYQSGSLTANSYIPLHGSWSMT